MTNPNENATNDEAFNERSFIISAFKSKNATYGTASAKKKLMLEVVRRENKQAISGLMGEHQSNKKAFDDLSTEYLQAKPNVANSMTAVKVSEFYYRFAEIFEPLPDQFMDDPKLPASAKDTITKLATDFRKGKDAASAEINKQYKSLVVGLTSIGAYEHRRAYGTGGGTIPHQVEDRTCFFCGHQNLDFPAGYDHQAVVEKNKVILAEHEVVLAEHNDAKAQLPRGAKAPKAPTLPKAEEAVVVCHCHQMVCSGGRYGQGDCPKCKEMGGGQVDPYGNCSCDVCQCPCKQAYKVCLLVILLTNVSLHLLLCVLDRIRSKVGSSGSAPTTPYCTRRRWGCCG